MPAGKLGRLAPHSEDTHPRVKLNAHLVEAALPPTPAVVDYASRVRSWPMYLNDQLGDCTCAGICHCIQAWTAYGKGLVTLPNQVALSLYEAVGGYVPGDPSTDNGCVEQDILAYAQEKGVGGHKILAYAQVDHTSPAEMKTALHLFGSLYLGAQMPESAMDQTNAGQPWTVVPGSPIEGGHCFVAQRWDTTDAPMTVVTWGQLQRVALDWWAANGEEAWIVITQDWFQANGKTVTGVNLAGLGDEFAIVTGQPNPFRQAAGKPWYCHGFLDKIFGKLASRA